MPVRPLGHVVHPSRATRGWVAWHKVGIEAIEVWRFQLLTACADMAGCAIFGFRARHEHAACFLTLGGRGTDLQRVHRLAIHVPDVWRHHCIRKDTRWDLSFIAISWTMSSAPSAFRPIRRAFLESQGTTLLPVSSVVHCRAIGDPHRREEVQRGSNCLLGRGRQQWNAVKLCMLSPFWRAATGHYRAAEKEHPDAGHGQQTA